jgi:hypothetical protein
MADLPVQAGVELYDQVDRIEELVLGQLLDQITGLAAGGVGGIAPLGAVQRDPQTGRDPLPQLRGEELP